MSLFGTISIYQSGVTHREARNEVETEGHGVYRASVRRNKGGQGDSGPFAYTGVSAQKRITANFRFPSMRLIAFGNHGKGQSNGLGDNDEEVGQYGQTRGM
jgi:hypothetical protein